MSTPISDLRTLFFNVEFKHREYAEFFPTFADRLVDGFAHYLGESDCVALCCAYDDFVFDAGRYAHDGFGLERGRFRIPLMVRLDADGTSAIRLRVYFLKEGARLTAQVEGLPGHVDFYEKDITILYVFLNECLGRLLKTDTELPLLRGEIGDYLGVARGFVDTELPKLPTIHRLSDFVVADLTK